MTGPCYPDVTSVATEVDQPVGVRRMYHVWLWVRQ